MSIGALIARTSRAAGRRTALVWGERRVRYRELDRRTNRVANTLFALAGHPGDRVALLLENGPEFIEAYLGAAKAGLVVVPLNPRLHPDELARVIADAEPALLLHDQAWGGVAAEISRAQPLLQTISVAAGYAELLQAAKDTPPGTTVSANAPLAIAYTSGTTGMPKGVVISHANAAASIRNGITAFGLNAGLRNVVFQPLVFHPLFVGHVLGPLAVGAQVTLLPQFDPEAYLDAVAAERATFLVHVPTTIRRVLEEQGRRPRDLSSVQTLFTGGAPITGALVEQAALHFPRLIQGYGLTEATNIVTCSTGTRPPGPRDCGGALPACELAIRDEEICVRGEVVMQGYWRNPAATAAAIRDGWLHTGDLGVLDDHGQLQVTGRLKDVIISGGVKIHATEVEDVIARHPAVAEVSVVGLPDPDWGETVQAWIVPRSGAAVTAQALIAHCEGHLARFKRPRQVVFLTALPKNANGKVRKDLLRQQRTEE